MNSYLICSSPRSGTNLLKNLLLSQGLGWASEFGSAAARPKYSDIKELMHRVDNNQVDEFNNKTVWSKTLWYYMREDFVDLLKDFLDIPKFMMDIDVIKHFFPEIKFIFLRREDKLAQAISLIKAQQSGEWIVKNSDKESKTDKTYEFDYDHIKNRIEFLTAVDAEWIGWLKFQDVDYINITYENLIDDLSGSAVNIVHFLTGEPSIDEDLIEKHCFNSEHSTKKQRDSHTEEWIERYNDEIR